MLTITNDHTTLTVSRGAFLSTYRSRGFRVVDEDEERELYPTPPEDDDTDLSNFSQQENDADEEEPEDDADEEDLSQIPLMDMNKEQLRAYADQLGLIWDTDMTKKELRELIKEHKEG